MLIQINKDGKNSRCGKRQLAAMKKAGWKVGTAKVKEVKKVDESKVGSKSTSTDAKPTAL